MSDGYYIRSFLATIAGVTAFIAVVAGLAFYSQAVALGFLCAGVFFLVWFYKSPVPKAARAERPAPSKLNARDVRESIGEVGGRYPR